MDIISELSMFTFSHKRLMRTIRNIPGCRKWCLRTVRSIPDGPLLASCEFSISKWGIPWTGYLVPARDGSWLLPDWESSWDVATAAAVTWKFRLTFRPGSYIWSFQIGFWHIWKLSEFWAPDSGQNFEPDWSSIVIWPGKPFWKTWLFSKYFQK